VIKNNYRKHVSSELVPRRQIKNQSKIKITQIQFYKINIGTFGFLRLIKMNLNIIERITYLKDLLKKNYT